MGILFSFLFKHKNVPRPRSLVELQRNILDYLYNEDYGTDPNKTFLSDVTGYGFSSLESFISKIPPSFVQKCQVSKPNSLVYVRAVLNKDPSRRAVILKRLNDSNIQIQLGCHEGGIKKLFTRLKYNFLFVVVNFLHSISRSRIRLSNVLENPLTLSVRSSEIQFEKDYLRSFLYIEDRDDASLEVGTDKGLHGGNNSCYLDSLLFVLFYSTNIFDNIFRSRKDEKDKYSKRTRRILKRDIVGPLRENFYCPYENVMKLRKHLGKMNEDILGSFMDVEEIFYILLQDVLNEVEYIKYIGENGDVWGDFMHLMCINEQDSSRVITVQQNVEVSFNSVNHLTLKEVPSPAFILGMPRSDRKLVHYEYVVPNLELDLNNIISIVDCSCGNTATYEALFIDMGPFPVCSSCLTQQALEAKIISRERMKLLGVICIRGAHFTAFSYSRKSSQWLYFDSMAGGYPEVTPVAEIDEWLQKLSADMQSIYNYEANDIPIMVERVIRDGHWCIYEPIVIAHP